MSQCNAKVINITESTLTYRYASLTRGSSGTAQIDTEQSKTIRRFLGRECRLVMKWVDRKEVLVSIQNLG
jgi:hypothetical protein